jgi:hypothetical protein
MVDPFTAFAAAGNALQFAELGVKLISKTIEYSSCGGSQEHQALQNVVQQLMASTAHLQESMNTYASQPQPGPARALHRANIECLRVSKEFYDLLNELKLNRYGTMWRSGELSSVLRYIYHFPEGPQGVVNWSLSSL